ncbi:hypothetical protein K469DRAFT_583935 [Zopfia rhizophila CBS 207.26]|uniref:PHD-type domain-containing protein n=1 Tax=Zopfia rhizophila CBS 207.26 TaxID=1314779 RepID=A0A6A6DXF4_9PEZI|nr:hypothetical protein K469DRAFT_583935 [Zopfia rhizophila CBS 207.26]
MSSISALLNPESTPEQPQAQSRPRTGSQEQYTVKTTTFEAADALTTLATLGSGQSYASRRDLPSPTTFSHAPRRTSSFSSHIAPVEPSPPAEPQAHSPTLDQYHHGSKSPEEQRRRSLLTRSSPTPILAPIQSLTNVLNDHIHDEPTQPTSYGKDVSQIVPLPSRSSEEASSGRDGTQNREPGFVRDEPTTSQIREPEGEIKSTPHPICTQVAVETPVDEENRELPSPTPVIKKEATSTPREATPSTTIAQSERQASVTTDSMDAETLKAIHSAELGLRAKKGSVSSPVPSPTETLRPILAPSKKRPAPATSAAAKKKGTAAPKKPAPKKRKIDTESADSNARSSTPTSRPKPASKTVKKGSAAGTPALESSPAPDNSSQVHSDEEADSSDDNTLYCICRKPDNHQWMIGCDGGCDDWFHGSCVNMVRADENLIDKFICPNCEAAGKGRTTWKPMCRREGCRQPARVNKKEISKYCSEACGVLFFEEQLQRTAGAKKLSTGKKEKGKRKSAVNKDADDIMPEEDSDSEPAPLGGVLRAKDLKALALASKDISAFKKLGSNIPSPPPTSSPTRTSFANGISNPDENLEFTPSEKQHLEALDKEKADLKLRLEVLKDREKFVSLVREQAAKAAEREKIKAKEFCGFDGRLTWSESEFIVWRNSRFGKAAFQFSTLDPSPEQIQSIPDSTEEDKAKGNGDAELADKGKEKEAMPTVCLRKRCPKHTNWQKLNLQDARFEEIEVVEAIKECEKEERSVKERVMRRGARKGLADSLGVEGSGEREGRNGEGWVEVIGPT